MNSSFFTTLSEIVEPEHTAVAVIDVQNDFCAKDGHHAKVRKADVSMMPAFLSGMRGFLDACRRFGIKIIFVQNHHSYGTDKISGPMLERWHRLGIHEQYCVQGSWGADFCHPISPQPEEPIVIKHRYSAFTNPEFEAWLKANKIASLVFVGLATNVCVEATAREAFMRDYYVVIVKDCVSTFSLAEQEMALRDASTHFGIVASSQELLNLWSEKLESGQGEGLPAGLEK